MASSQSLSQYREIIATLSGGEEVNEEALMTMWYSTNWIEILQPAPLSIALLGSVLCIASGTNDFSVFYKHPEGPVLTIFSPRSSHSTARTPAQDRVEACQASGLIQNLSHAGQLSATPGSPSMLSLTHRWLAMALSPLKMHIRKWRRFRPCPNRFPVYFGILSPFCETVSSVLCVPWAP